MVIEILLYIVLMITAFPVGKFLNWICEEEMIPGKKWFKVILVSLIGLFVLGLVFYRNIPSLLTLMYMIIVTFVALRYKK